MHISQFDHVADLIETWPEKLKQSESAKTPAPSDLFEKGGGRLLGNVERELFTQSL